MSRILITGSHGLVGTAMKSLLTSAGHNVRSLDLRAPQGDGGGDVLDLRAVETAATECDGILHFAAVSRVIWGERDPALCRATNEGGTRNILRAALASPRPPLDRLRQQPRGLRRTRRVARPPKTLCSAPSTSTVSSKVAGERLLARGPRSRPRHRDRPPLQRLRIDVHDHADRVVPAFARARPRSASRCASTAPTTRSTSPTSTTPPVGSRPIVDSLQVPASAAPPPIHFRHGHPHDPRRARRGHRRRSPDRRARSSTRPRADFDVARFYGDPSRARTILGWQPRIPAPQRPRPTPRRPARHSFPRAPPMKILKVIHGYPMRYNAGSEVYSQTLCHGLAERHEVHVFTREEDAFAPDFRLRTRAGRGRPARHRARGQQPPQQGPLPRDGDRPTLRRGAGPVQPDIVHVGHLNHLSTSLVRRGRAARGPDRLHAPRLLADVSRADSSCRCSPKTRNLWAACDGQEDRKCAERCYARYFSGAPEERDADVAYWTNWVARRMQHVREMVELVDLFIAPATLPPRSLPRRLRPARAQARLPRLRLRRGRGWPGAARRWRALHVRLHRHAHPGEGHPPPDRRLRLASAATRGFASGAVHAGRTPTRCAQIAARSRATPAAASSGSRSTEPGDRPRRLQPTSTQSSCPRCGSRTRRSSSTRPSRPASPSSPPTSEAWRSTSTTRSTACSSSTASRPPSPRRCSASSTTRRSPRASAQRVTPSPTRATSRASTSTSATSKPSTSASRPRRDSARVRHAPGPWRITFDTNPDTCNLRCIMCEEHSPHSPLQIRRKQDGIVRAGLMPFEMIERVIAEAAPGHGLREVIPSTMGEPLLYEHFEGILDLCHRHRVKLNLTTNGTFPGRGRQRLGRADRPRHLRRQDLVERRDQGHPRGHHARRRWEKVLENVRDFIAVRDATPRRGATAAGSPSSSRSWRATSPSWPTSCASRSTSASTA
jgi:hypothetical protein